MQVLCRSTVLLQVLYIRTYGIELCSVEDNASRHPSDATYVFKTSTHLVSLFGMSTKVQADVVRGTAEATVEHQLRQERLEWFAHLQRISIYVHTTPPHSEADVEVWTSRKAEGDGRFNSSTMGRLVKQETLCTCIHTYSSTAAVPNCGKMWCETR